MERLNTITVILFFCSLFVYPQANTGIGIVTPDDSAILHLESSNKALLPPRVNLVNGKFDQVTISNPSEGLLVYHTGNAVLVKGMYVWNGAAWGELFDSAPQAPDFESAWIPFSAQNGASSFLEVTHGLGVVPAELYVEVRAVDGNNIGYIFPGLGSASQDDDPNFGTFKNYGGVVFASSNDKIRLWAPDQNNESNFGRCIYVGDGWGGEINSQNSNSCEIRIRAWKQWGKP